MGVRSDGYVIPCCFFGSQHAFDEIKELLGDDIENIHLKSGKTLDEINISNEYQRIEETWKNNPLKTCIAACSRPEDIADIDRHSTGAKYIIKDLKR